VRKQVLVPAGGKVVEHRKQLHSPTEGLDHGDALVVYASKGKTFLTALVGFTFVVAMVVLPVVLGPDPGPFGNPTMLMLAQIVGGAAGGIVSIRMLTILFSPAPRIVVSHDGIWVSSLLFGAAIIPWADIGALRVVGHRLPPVANLLIVLRDRQALRDRQTRLQVMLCWLGGQAMVWPQSVVTAADLMLPMSIADLLGQIRVCFEHELVQHAIQVQGA
jgi:hypothetical protein